MFSHVDRPAAAFYTVKFAVQSHATLIKGMQLINQLSSNCRSLTGKLALHLCQLNTSNCIMYCLDASAAHRAVAAATAPAVARSSCTSKRMQQLRHCRASQKGYYFVSSVVINWV